MTLFVFEKHHIVDLNVLLYLIYHVTQLSDEFEWLLEKRRLWNTIRAALEAVFSKWDMIIQ